MSGNIAVICPFGADGGLISKAVSLTSGAVRALVPMRDAATAAAMGAARVHTLPDDLSIADEAAFARWLAEKLRLWGDTVVLAPATVAMRNIMPMTAWHLQAGLTADCTAISMEDGRLVQTRPAFGNNMLADIRTVTDVQMATVRPATFRPLPHPAADATVTAERYTEENGAVAALEFTPYADGVPLGQAEVIVAGGLGIGSTAGFEKLAALADKLGGAVAASRSAVDAGFAPYRCQVGITGVTVSPKLYIAVGISGAVQHLSGMSAAETVIAINSDPHAPIFDYADYGIVGDWETVINQILEE